MTFGANTASCHGSTMGSVPDGLITRESRETVLSHLEANEPLETLESHER